MLVVVPNWVGDLVLATPALVALREQYAKAHITVLGRAASIEVLSGADWMNDVLCWPSRKRQSRREQREGFLGFVARVRERRYDWAVLMTNSFRSALATRLAGIPRRIGYDRDGRGLLLTDRLLAEKVDGKYLPVPMTRYYNAIARYLGCREVASGLELRTTPEEEAAVDIVFREAAVRADQPVVVLNPGASYGPAKCWLPERYAETADRLIERQGVAVIITCGPKETEVARSVARSMKHKVHVLDNPVLKLGASKALIRRASLLITNDTGPRHFANAFGTPVVTIFGPTDPEWTRTESLTERCLIEPIECGPCMKRICPLGHHDCMKLITVDAVVSSAEELPAVRVSAAGN
jgi:heptosyltransferase-2